MKKMMIAALALALCVSSCKKDEETALASATGAVTASNYGFDTNASLGKFSSTKATITQSTANGVTTLTVRGIKDGSSEAIILTLIQPTIAVGNVNVNGSVNNGEIIISKDINKLTDLSVNYSTGRRSPTGNGTGGGNIAITKLDGKNVEGTFYAVGYNSSGASAYAENGTFKGTIN